jgi:hypothetical protein
MFKPQREFQIPETVAPADTLLHNSTVMVELSQSGAEKDVLN